MKLYKIRDTVTGKYLGSRAAKFTRDGDVWKNEKGLLQALYKLEKYKHIHWDNLEIIEYSLKEEKNFSAKHYYFEHLFF